MNKLQENNRNDLKTFDRSFSFAVDIFWNLSLLDGPSINKNKNSFKVYIFQ